MLASLIQIVLFGAMLAVVLRLAVKPIMVALASLGAQLARVELKLDKANDVTPVLGVTQVRIPSVMVDMAQLDEDDTPVDNPAHKATPPKGSPGIYGPKKP